MAEDNLAAADALVEGCFSIAGLGATQEGGLGAQPDSLEGSLIANSTRGGSTYRAWSMGVSGSTPVAVGSDSYWVPLVHRPTFSHVSR